MPVARVICDRKCGACCDGTLFPVARLGDDEWELALSLGMTITHGRNEQLAFRQPCPQVTASGLCAVHDKDRPRVCSSFVCTSIPNRVTVI